MALAASIALAGCGSGHHHKASQPAQTATTKTEPASGSHQKSRRESPTRTVRSYVRAVNDHDGGRLCKLLVPGKLGPLQLSDPGAGCARSLSVSIGRRGRHGEPRWLSAKLVQVVPPAESGGIDRVTISLRHRLQGATGEVPTEQDIVYLEPKGSGWLIVKPSALLYRAVGIGDVPLDALKPPAG